MNAAGQLRTTHQVPLREAPNVGIAYADFSGAQKYDPNQDCVVFSQDETESGSAMQYSELKQRVDALGGRASAAQLVGHTDDRTQEVGPKWIAFAETPLGLSHPIVDYIFHSDEKGMSLDYVVQHKAQIIPSDPNVDPAQATASVDLNGDGVSEPAHDSLLHIVSNLKTGAHSLTSGIGFQRLQETLRGAGGEADGVTLGRLLAEADGLEVNSTEFKAIPERLHGESTRDVRRHFSLAKNGAIEITYSLDQNQR